MELEISFIGEDSSSSVEMDFPVPAHGFLWAIWDFFWGLYISFFFYYLQLHTNFIEKMRLNVTKWRKIITHVDEEQLFQEFWKYKTKMVASSSRSYKIVVQ